jgi:hypothetical protein
MESKPMESRLVYQPLDRVEADAVAIILCEEEPPPAELKFATAWLDELRASGEFVGKSDELAVLHQPHGLTAKRLAVVGGGKRAAYDSAVLRKAVSSAVRKLKQKGVKTLAWWLASGDPEAAVEGAYLGNFEPDRYKTSSDAKPLEAFHVVAAATGTSRGTWKNSGRIPKLHARAGE